MKENEMKLDLNNFDQLMDEAMKGELGNLVHVGIRWSTDNRSRPPQ